MAIPSIDVPQADTLDLLVKLLATLWNDEQQKPASIANELRIDRRQVEYYKQAARILGFLSVEQGRVEFTDRGRALMQATRLGERHEMLRTAVLENALIDKLLSDHRPEELSGQVVARFLARNTKLTGATVPRRAQTILSWIRTVLEFDPFDSKSLAKKAAESAEEQYSHYRAVEEGPLHRRLKETIAHDPFTHLRRKLQLVQMEFPFPTNDRADVLFVDEENRFFVVEVEVDVGPRDLPGLLQAVKYKHMLAVIHGLRPEDVRSALVARSIHPTMRERAKEYGIECIEVHGVI